MALDPGTRLGGYEIRTLLGAGGMGEVYRARDTTLGRDVALKILPASFSSDPERVARFRREAHVLASLNHPHIAQIYGLEALERPDGASSFLVLELVDGESLDRRLAPFDGGSGRLEPSQKARRPIPVDEALDIAKQIAEALEAAHEKGIIHRDLKPANIAVTKDGQVKVLDFGLAKPAEPTASAAHGSLLPTITSPAMLSDVGVILGTAAYMAPEQAKGLPADKRVDIWAFGCVFFEMLSGQRAFVGDDVATAMAAILTAEPDWSALPAAVPPVVVDLIRRCLEKNTRERLRDIGEARVILGRRSDATSARALRATPPSLPVWMVACAALMAGLLGGAAGAYFWSPRSAKSRVARFALAGQGDQSLNVSGAGRDLVVTPDGSRVVYVGANGTALFVRAFDQLEPTLLVRGAPRDPFVSPDGQWIGFFDGGFTLKKAPLNGGPPVLVARLNSYERGAAWLDDGTIVFAMQTSLSGIQRVNANGGEVSVLTRPDRAQGEAGHAWPEPLPGGHSILFTITSVSGGVDAASIAVLDTRTGKTTTLLRGGTHAQYDSNGHLLYGGGGALRVVRFDAARSAIVGQPVAIVPQVATTAFGAVNASVARDGTLTYVQGGATSDRTLVWVDGDGRESPSSIATGRGAGAYYFPRIAPDGAHAVVNSVVDQNADLWLWDLERDTLTRVTSDPANEGFPLFTADSRRLVFASNRVGAFNIFVQAADGSGDAERLTNSPEPQFPTGASPDGTRLLFTQTSTTTGDDVMEYRFDDRRVAAIVQTPFDERNGMISPDGRWLAYEANDTGTFEIYVRPYPNVAGGRWQVSTAGGYQPLWNPRSGDLCYFATDGALMRVAVGHSATWAAAPPARMFDARYLRSTGGNSARNYDISRDGKRFLLIKGGATAAQPIIVVQGFLDAVERSSVR